MDGTLREQRCGPCGAAVRPGAPWCTQCYAPTAEPAPGRIPTAPVQPAQASTAPARPVPAAGTSPIPPTSAPDVAATWPCTACAADNPLPDDACGSCGAAFLSGAREREPLLLLPVVGDLTALPPGRRIALAVAVVAGFVVLCTVLGLLLA